MPNMHIYIYVKASWKSSPFSASQQKLRETERLFKVRAAYFNVTPNLIKQLTTSFFSNDAKMTCSLSRYPRYIEFLENRPTFGVLLKRGAQTRFMRDGYPGGSRGI